MPEMMTVVRCLPGMYSVRWDSIRSILPTAGISSVPPLLDECTLKLAGNKEFRIRTIRKSPEDIYIQSVTLNGKKHKDFFITHQDIMNGGTMVFKMGKKPSGWGK